MFTKKIQCIAKTMFFVSTLLNISSFLECQANEIDELAGIAYNVSQLTSCHFQSPKVSGEDQIYQQVRNCLLSAWKVNRLLFTHALEPAEAANFQKSTLRVFKNSSLDINALTRIHETSQTLIDFYWKAKGFPTFS